MKQVYLIRHSTPDIGMGVCYGQSDIDVTESFTEEAFTIKSFLPGQVDQVYSSPLVRCRKLGNFLFPGADISYERDLMEIHCGIWEMRCWDDIPREEVMPWMNDFVHRPIPRGESYTDLYGRVVDCFGRISSQGERVAVVSHGGVIRSILSHITGTALEDSFQAFRIHYGSVIRLTAVGMTWTYEVLTHGLATGERHKPSFF